MPDKKFLNYILWNFIHWVKRQVNIKFKQRHTTVLSMKQISVTITSISIKLQVVLTKACYKSQNNLEVYNILQYQYSKNKWKWKHLTEKC